MAQITVAIAGRTYRMACEDGQERHLTALAADLDGRIAELRGAFGEIGEMRLHVMAALSVADELDGARRRAGDAERRAAAAAEDDARRRDAEAALTETLHALSARVERVADALSARGDRDDDV